MPEPVLLLTRPLPDSQDLAREIAAAHKGAAVVLSPLMRIVPAGQAPETGALAGLIFTSANGVQAWLARELRCDLPVWTVGRATACAARGHFDRITSADGDADALVGLLLADAPVGPLCHVRGRHVRGDVAGRLAAAGLNVTEAVLYDQAEQPLKAPALAALAGRAPVILPLYSLRTADLLAAQGPFSAPLHVVAMSQAVAEAASGLAPANIVIAEHPDGPSMHRAILLELRGLSRLEGNTGDR